jgi:hypothetical protein
MDPAIYSGDKVTVDTAFYSQHPIADGDIIVFHRNGSVMVKRVSAISGETIEGKNGKLIRNGASLAEPYLHEPTISQIRRKRPFPHGQSQPVKSSSPATGDPEALTVATRTMGPYTPPTSSGKLCTSMPHRIPASRAGSF